MNRDDIARAFASLMDEDELPFRYTELPVADYGFPMRDEVRSADGACIGQSQRAGFSMNVRRFLSLAFIEKEYAEPGTKVTLIWGEPNGGPR